MRGVHEFEGFSGEDLNLRFRQRDRSPCIFETRRRGRSDRWLVSEMDDLQYMRRVGCGGGSIAQRVLGSCGLMTGIPPPRAGLRASVGL